MNKTLVWAHRGASGYAPENTLVAFQKAIEQRADGIELDVQMTKDGTLVILHDETLKRVSGAKGWLKDYTYEKLIKLNVNLKFPEYGSVRIPTLREVFELVKDTDILINVELKNGIVFYHNLEERVLELTEEIGLKERIIYSSFNHYSVMKLKELDPTVNTAFLYEDGYLHMPEYAVRYGVEALHPALYNLQYPDFIKNCRENGILIRAWTVNDIEDMNKLCENQIDGMITNYPDIGRKVVEEYGREFQTGQ